MPLYFFDVRSGDALTVDTAGEGFPDVSAARDVALSIIASVARDEMPDVGRREFMIRVRDETDRVVFTTSFFVEADTAPTDDE